MSVYFTKKKKWFTKAIPEGHFNSIVKPGNSPLQNHLGWLDAIRMKIWGETASLAKALPSGDALQFHWKRSVWVLDMWRQSLQNVVKLLPMDKLGWTITDSTFDITWESQVNTDKVKEHVRYLPEGCGCKKGDCSNKHCGCQKRGVPCGPACTCDST